MILPVKLDQRKTLGPIGFCIYCGRSNLPLTSEHIVPQGLGGRIELLESSCFRCAKETGSVEQECLKKIIGPVRYRMGLSTRKKNKDPRDIHVDVINEGDAFERTLLQLAEHPASFVLFVFAPPDILFGLPPRAEFTIREKMWAHLPGHADPNTTTKYGGKGFRMGSFHPMLFSRMLAKIAHSFAVADQGLDSFIPYLPPLILGDYGTPSYLVGGEFEIPEAISTLHRLHLHCMYPYATGDAGALAAPQKQFLVVDIRLFANFGAPLYRVVVGQWKGRKK